MKGRNEHRDLSVVSACPQHCLTDGFRFGLVLVVCSTKYSAYFIVVHFDLIKSLGSSANTVTTLSLNDSRMRV